MRLVGILLLTKNLGRETHTSHILPLHLPTTFCLGCEVNPFVNSGLDTRAHKRLDSPNLEFLTEDL